MPELVVLSGKGGTGKTSITSSLAVLASKTHIVDCDVDAANLHLVLQPEVQETYDFIGGWKAEIDAAKCVQCGKCIDVCRFGAISATGISELECEGCGVCHYICPVGAINLRDHKGGEYYRSQTAYGQMVHAKLGFAEGNSGKLVAEIRNLARKLVQDKPNALTIIDGPPGLGCPVISTLTGADYALIVTEPTVSGVHDLQRVLELVQQLGVAAAVCINKSDLSPERGSEIKAVCSKLGVPVLGEIPFDKSIVEALGKSMPIVLYDKMSCAAKSISALWQELCKWIEEA